VPPLRDLEYSAMPSRSKFGLYALTLFAVLSCLIFLPTKAKAATVSYSQDFPGSDPEHYTITVSNDGHSRYKSDGKLSQQQDPGDEEEFSFVLSPQTTQQIFELTKRAHYFEGKIDSKKKVASTGTKILIYHDGAQENKATFNYSSVSSVQALTQLFQGLSSTLEFGRRLQYYYRHQKLGLNEQLTNMEDAQAGKQLGDITPVLPILNEIAKDPTVINVARSRAMRIIAGVKY
jgi:hypothetical protein